MKINKYHENEQIPSSGTHLVDEDYGRVKNSGSQKWEGDLRYMVIVLKKKKKNNQHTLKSWNYWWKDPGPRPRPWLFFLSFSALANYEFVSLETNDSSS